MYEIFVNGLFMGEKVTRNSALALVSVRWHGVENVEIRKRGAVIWRA